MKIVKKRSPDKYERVYFSDVDDTLILYPPNIEKPTKGSIPIECPYDKQVRYYVPSKKHIKLLKDHYSRGYYVIVWSASGGLWAEAVVNALKLNEYVCDVICKPAKFCDDLPPSEWMGNRIDLEVENRRRLLNGDDCID